MVLVSNVQPAPEQIAHFQQCIGSFLTELALVPQIRMNQNICVKDQKPMVVDHHNTVTEIQRVSNCRYKSLRTRICFIKQHSITEFNAVYLHVKLTLHLKYRYLCRHQRNADESHWTDVALCARHVVLPRVVNGAAVQMDIIRCVTRVACVGQSK